MKYYKVLSVNGEPCHGGSGRWNLPKGKRRGKWMPVINDIVPCIAGYHLVTRGQLTWWLGVTLWEAEGRGEHIKANDKHVFAQARLIRKLDNWNGRTARLYACDCAEHMLWVFEKAYPNDKRPHEVIETSRRYALGLFSCKIASRWRAASSL